MGSDGSGDALIPRLFEAAVARHPHAPAIESPSARLDFDDLNRAANRLAHYLRDELGVRRDDAVAVLLDDGERLITSLLAILKAGGAYLPLDPRLPTARLLHILEESRPRALLTANGALLPTAARTPPVDLDVLDLRGARDDNPAPVNAPDDLAYLIYTSGSTGRPKGILQTHRCLANFVSWQIADANIERGLRVLQFAAPGFDVSVQEILFALISGGCLVTVDGELRRDLDRLARYMIDTRVEVADFPFSVIRLLLELPSAPLTSPHLRHLISAGEPLAIGPELRALLERRPELTLHNHYGPSETHMLTSHSMSASRGNLESHPPLGNVIWNMHAYVLDDDGRSLGPGQVGEIYIGGAGLARGYHDAALTARKFLPHPFRAGERIYKTDDLGRWRADGALEILGRKDHQVKVRGYRIELEEIERVLLQLAGVRQAAVMCREAADGQRELVGYLAAEPTVSEAAVRAQLAAVLPDYMVPQRWVRADGFALSPNGKIDRSALPATPAPAPACLVDATALERRVAAVWSAVLERPVGLDDDLFAFGCDSLRATRLIARLSAELGSPLALRELFTAPSVRALARHVAARAPNVVEPPPGGAALAGDRLVPAEAALWLTDQLGGDVRASYQFCEVYALDEDVDLDALAGALAVLTERHDALRTSYVTVDGEPRRRVAERVALPLARVEPSGGDPRALAQAACERPFDLTAAPLCRAVVVIDGGAPRYLLLSLHQIICDAWSAEVLARELAAAYAAIRRGASPVLPPAPSYREHVVVRERWLASADGDAARRYYLERLVPPAPRLRPDIAPAPRRSYAGAAFMVELGAPLRDVLNAACRGAQVTPFMVLASAFAIALRPLVGDDVVFGTMMDGRGVPGLDTAVGLYVNLVLLRVPAAGAFADVLAATTRAVLDAHRHQAYPFERLAAELPAPVEPWRAPGFDVGFQLLRGPRAASGGGPTRVLTRWAERARNLVWVSAVDDGHGLSLLVERSSAVISHGTAERLAARMIDVVRAALADPTARTGASPAAAPFAFQFER